MKEAMPAPAQGRKSDTEQKMPLQAPDFQRRCSEKQSVLHWDCRWRFALGSLNSIR
jgi:hypothetical protein